MKQKKPPTEVGGFFERRIPLAVFADAAEGEEAGEAQAHQQGAGGFGDDGKIIHHQTEIIDICRSDTRTQSTRIKLNLVKARYRHRNYLCVFEVAVLQVGGFNGQLISASGRCGDSEGGIETVVVNSGSSSREIYKI